MTEGYVTTAPLRSRIAIHSYGTNPTPWYAFVRALLPPADRLVDVGAGTGALWEDGAPSGLVTADASPAMCAALAERGLPVVRARAERLPFGDASFGGAVCNHMLYHLPDPREGLAELRRVVRPGGWVAVATNGTGHMAEASAVARAAGVLRAAADVHAHFPAETLGDALGEFFADVAVHRYDDTLLVPDAGPVVAYVASLADRPLTAAEEAAVTTAVEDRIARDGAFRIGKHTVLAVAHAPRT